MIGPSSGCDGVARPLRPDAAALGPSGAVCPPDGPLGDESFARPIIDPNCPRCHAAAVRGADRQGAPSSHPFDSLGEIRADAEAIDELAAAGSDRVNTDMPRSFPAPTDAERRALGEWLACGAPE